MDFIPQPEEAKKFGTSKWFKWHIYKYPHIFILCLPVPVIIYKCFEIKFRFDRQFKDGSYVPGVVQNRYAVCRPDDWLAKTTPKRYHN